MRAYSSIRAGLLSAADQVGFGANLRALRQSTAPHFVRRDALDNRLITSILAAKLSAGDNCLDVGANCGEHLRTMVRCAPTGRHVAYEPIAELSADLRRTFPTVDVREAALGAIPGTRTFEHVTTAPAYSGFRQQDYPREFNVEQIAVEVETIDSQFLGRWAPNIVKIDVEGAEFEVISGGVQVLQKAQPLIVFEFFKGSADHYGIRPIDLFNLITRDIGLTVYDIDGQGPYSSTRFDEAYEESRLWTFMAHP